VHLVAGIGTPLTARDIIDRGREASDQSTGRILDVSDRTKGGLVRVVASAQTQLFAAPDLDRFAQTAFTRDTVGNRQGVRLAFEGQPFAAQNQLSILSEVIAPGDLQLTGDGRPYALLPDCQTTGGYPRIATIVPEDMPRIAQAAPGTGLSFQFVDLDDAIQSHRKTMAEWQNLAGKTRALVRDPAEMKDLLAYQLISGVTSGSENERS
jgi:allophanate hydrolase